eukprot:2106231-Prymnesium_polylepis.1
MGDDQVHWFSILNSLVIVLLLSGIVAMIMVRTLRRDLAEYNSIEEKVRPHRSPHPAAPPRTPTSTPRSLGTPQPSPEASPHRNPHPAPTLTLT